MRFVGNQTRFFHEFWEFSGEIRLGIFGNSRFSRRFPGSSRRSRKTRKSGIRSSWIRSCCSRGSRTWSRSWKTGSDPRTSESGIPRRWRWEFPKKFPGKSSQKFPLQCWGRTRRGRAAPAFPGPGKAGMGLYSRSFRGLGFPGVFLHFQSGFSQFFPIFQRVFSRCFLPIPKDFSPTDWWELPCPTSQHPPNPRTVPRFFPGFFPQIPFPPEFQDFPSPPPHSLGIPEPQSAPFPSQIPGRKNPSAWSWSWTRSGARWSC